MDGATLRTRGRTTEIRTTEIRTTEILRFAAQAERYRAGRTCGT